MEEKNELNDIILNKGDEASTNKKILLAVGTLGIILIVVVLLMNTLTSNGTDNLPQAVLPPEPQSRVASQMDNEPLFEDVDVIQEEAETNNNLDEIAQRLKQESMESKKTSQETQKVEKQVQQTKTVQATVVTQKAEAPKKQTATPKAYYVQVGSFSKYQPNKKFLKSITDKGFTYKYHKVVKNAKTLNKVLVGPFNNEKEARDALREIRSSVEAGAFLVKI